MARLDNDRDDLEPKRSRRNAYWWRNPVSDKTQVHKEIVAHAKWLWQCHAPMRARDRIHARIYRSAPSMRSGEYAEALKHLAARGYSRTRLNVSKSITDTAVARLSRKRQMPSMVTDDSDWDFTEKARILTRFMKGKIQETDFDRMTPLCLRDACLRGTGLVKVVCNFGEIVPERTPKREILVDPRDARYGSPRQLHQVKRYAREVLAEMFPEHRERIRDAAPPMAHYYDDDNPDVIMDGDESDQIEVYESWHLPSSPEADDGRHAICIDTATLCFDAWERPRFPFARVHWTPPDEGFWGYGLIEETASIQHQINQIVRDVQQNLEVTGKVIAFVRRGSNVVKNHIVGRGPMYVEFDGGVAPQFHVPEAVSPTQIQLLDKHIQWAFDMTGVSQMAAQSKNPLGAGASGVALNNFDDQQSERFSLVESGYGNFRLDAAELFVDAAYDAAKEREESKDKAKKKYFSTYTDKNTIEKIDWSKVDLSRDQFKVRLEGVNFLPDTRAGKLAAVEQLSAAGVIDREMSASGFDEPDIERINRLRNAPRDNIMRIMGVLADVNQPMPVLHPYIELKQALKIVVQFINYHESKNAKDNVLARFREYADLIKYQQKEAAKGEAPPAGAMPPDPGGPPMGPPGGEMLPPEMGGEMPMGMPPPVPTDTGMAPVNPAAPMLPVAA